MPNLTLSTLFPHAAAIDGQALIDGRMEWKNVPAKPAVYLLTGPDLAKQSEDHPYLLATVGNLRAAIVRRLTDTPADIHSKRIEYGQVCNRLHWRIVHSPFAANFYYWQAARSLFADSYRQMIAWRGTWWIAVEKHGEFPRLRRTQDLSDNSLQYAGPVRDKAAAGKLIETVEDLFDLCRYHAVLLQAPHGKPCAYKEMGKCPAPCDGSVPLSWYRGQVAAALGFISGDTRNDWRSATELGMKSAAAALQFEQAGRIKQRLTRGGFIDGEAFARLAPLESCAWIALQPGQGRTRIEPWLVHPGLEAPVRALGQIEKKELPAAMELLFNRCRQLAPLPVSAPIPADITEQLGLLAHHLFKGHDDPGVYLRLSDVLVHGSELLLRAAGEILNRKSPPKPLPENASDKIAGALQSALISGYDLPASEGITASQPAADI